MISSIFRFKHLANAVSFANRCVKPHRIIMGEDDLYWVVGMGHAEILIAGGYEEVPYGL